MNKVIHGDCLEVLKTLPDNSVDAVVTDPPYGLSFMGKKWDYDVPKEEVWRECLRVLKHGGYLLAFAGTRTQHRMAVRIEDAGFEIRDMIAWVYGCLSEDTEVLTKDGFKHFHKITQDDIIRVYDTQNDIYKWEKPQRWSQYAVEQDTAYRIKSDTTDQIVSRNHNCLVEREGKLIFVKAEDLLQMERVPVLSGDISILQEGQGELLHQELLWQSKGLVEKILSERTGQEASRNGIERGEESSVEGWSDVQKEKGEICRPENKVCEMSARVSNNGEKGRVCNGTQIESRTGDTKTADKNGVCSSHQSRCNGQQDTELNAIQDERGTQEIRTRTTYNTTLATIEKIEYSGIIFCPTVSTGAFVARRNGQVFITGNSGFPKSLNIGKAVDALQGNERELVAVRTDGAGNGNSENVMYDADHKFSATKVFNETKGTSPWEGWGTALKPSHEDITVAQKPVDNDWLFNKSVRAILQHICQYQLLAKTVRDYLALNQSELKEDVSIAQWIADERTNIQVALSVLMDMLQSDNQAANTNSNIVLSWLNTLGDLYSRWSTYTTETKISLITDLKTLNYLLAQNTQSDITKEGIVASGVDANASIVGLTFSALRLKLQTIHALSANESAIERASERGIRPNLEPITVARKPLGIPELDVVKTVEYVMIENGITNIIWNNVRNAALKKQKEDVGTVKKELTQPTEKEIGEGSEKCPESGIHQTLEKYPSLTSDTPTNLDAKSCLLMAGNVCAAENKNSHFSQSTTSMAEEHSTENEQRKFIMNLNEQGFLLDTACFAGTAIVGTGSGYVHIKRNTDGTFEWPDTLPKYIKAQNLNVAQNCLKWGVGGINIDGCRVATNEKLSIGSNNHTNAQVFTHSQTIVSEQNSLGRFPANLIHDGSDEVVELFPNDNARFFYCAKASKAERNRGCKDLQPRFAPTMANGIGGKEHDPDTATPKNNFHPTVKPIALMEYLVKLVSREGAVVLDPFAGSGSTLLACKNLNRQYIGIEREQDYINIINARLGEPCGK